MLSLQEGEEREVCNLSNSLEDEVGGGLSTVQVPDHVTTQPHLPTTPHNHYNHKKLFTQDHVEGWQEKITLHLPVFVFVFFIYCVE